MDNEKDISTEELVTMDIIVVKADDCLSEGDSGPQPVGESQPDSSNTVSQKLSVNRLTYKGLLKKEEAENETVASSEHLEDLDTSAISNSKFNITGKLMGAIEHLKSSFQVFISLLKYAMFIIVVAYNL